MKILAIIQAEKDSSRFKNKVLSRLCEFITLEHVIIRTLRYKLVDVMIIATTERKEDDEIAQIDNKWEIKVFRGSEESLTHFFEVARIYRLEHIIRIKADCSALDSKVVNICHYLSSFQKCLLYYEYTSAHLSVRIRYGNFFL